MLFCRKEDVVSRREGDKTLVFHQNPGWACILNPTSTFLWEHCEGKLTVAELAELLAARFDVPEAYAERADLEDLVTQDLKLLVKADLLESIAA